MKVLLLEDDDLKRNHIAQFLGTAIDNLVLDTAKSVHSGVKSLIRSMPDLVILDMTMTAFDPGVDEDGGNTKHYAGREILRQMESRDITAPVIVVTQYERFGEGEQSLTLGQLDEQLREAHENYLGAVQYRSEVDGWKEALLEKIRQLPRRGE